MKRAQMLLVVGLAGCTANESTQRTSSVQDSIAIQQVLAQRITALNSGDEAGWLSLWTDDVRLIDPVGNDIVAIEALRAWAAPYFAQLTMEYVDTAIFGRTVHVHDYQRVRAPLPRRVDGHHVRELFRWGLGGEARRGVEGGVGKHHMEHRQSWEPPDSKDYVYHRS